MNLHCRYRSSLLALSLCWAVPLAAHAQRVVVLSVDTTTSTMRTISGCKGVVTGEFAATTFVHFVLPEEANARQRLLDSAIKLNPSVVLAVGSLATQLAQGNFPKCPI